MNITRIKETAHGDVVLLSLSGKMMNGPESVDLYPYVKQMIADGKKQVIVDMGKIKWFSSTGLGALMASYASLKNSGGEMKIARPTRRIYSVFYQMELNNFFDTYDKIDDALNAFEMPAKKPAV